MTQEEDFQYVFSQEDYTNFKNSQAKCQELTKLLAQTQHLHSQDKEKYLFKIQKLESQLKSYRSSIRQYVDRQVKQIDSLLKVLHDYRSSQSKSTVDLKTLDKIRSECDKITQTFDISLKDLEILNTEVIIVIKSLIKDSLVLHQKLKEYSEQYENSLEEKQNLYAKIRHLNQRSTAADLVKQKFIKNQQILKYQNQRLKTSLKQKQTQNTQLQIKFDSLRNKSFTQINCLKDQNSQNQKKWKQRLETTEKKLQKDLFDLKTQKQNSTKTLMQEIQKLREKIRALMQDCEEKESRLKQFEIAYKQQSNELQQFKQEAQQTQVAFSKKYEDLRDQYQKSIQKSQRQAKVTLEKFVQSAQQDLRNRQRTIRQLENTINQKNDVFSRLQREYMAMRDKQNQTHLQNRKLKQTLSIERQEISRKMSLLREELNERTIQLKEKEQNVKYVNELVNEYQQKYQLQEHIVQQLKKQIDTYEQNYSELDSKLALKTQQLKRIEHQFTQSKQLEKQIDQLRKMVAICESEKGFLEDNSRALTEELVKLRKVSQQEKNKLSFENEQFIIQLKVTVDNLEKKKAEIDELNKILSEVKTAKNNVEVQYCHMSELYEKERKKNKEYTQQISMVSNQVHILRQSLEDSQSSQESLFKEIDVLRSQARNGQLVQQASNLLKMNVQTLQTEVERLNKQKNLMKKEREASNHELSQAKEEMKYLNDDLNSMRQYIDELEQNLEKLSQEKAALRNEIILFKEQAQYCKRESIEQLGIIDKLERQLECAKQDCRQNFRKQLKNASESIDPSSIVRRSSLSKGEKSYYVKEMILEYSNEMKKNLLEIGALSHEEIKDLIFSELRQLGNYLKKLQREFQ